MAPEVNVGPMGVVALFLRVLNSFWLAVVFGMAALAKLVALSGRDAKAYAFADVGFVVGAAVGAPANHFAVFYDHAGVRHGLVERVSARVFFGFSNKLVVFGYIFNNSIFWHVRI